MNLKVVLIIKIVAIIILLFVMTKQNLFVRKNGLYKKITLIVMLCIAGYYLFYLFPIISKFDKFMIFFLSGFSNLFLLYLVIIEIVGLVTKKESDNSKYESINESINDVMLETNYNYENYNTREKRHSSNLLDNIYNLYVQDCEKVLKAPRTARFCNKEDLAITKQNGVYTVSGWVDSQNSYGAFVRTKLSIKIVCEDGLLIIKSHASKSAAKSFLGNMAARYIIAIIFTLITFAIFYFIISEF